MVKKRGRAKASNPRCRHLTVSVGLIVSEDPKKKGDEEEKKEGEPQGEEAEAALAAAKKKKKLILIGAIAGVVLLFAVAGGGYFYLSSSKAKTEKQTQAAEEPKSKPVYYSLGDMIVNLSGEGKHPHYLKVKISLELADEKDLPLIETIKPRVVDNFQVYLRELRMEDLRGSAGIYRLREELLMRVTEATQPIRVRDVLFQEMLVQ